MVLLLLQRIDQLYGGPMKFQAQLESLRFLRHRNEQQPNLDTFVPMRTDGTFPFSFAAIAPPCTEPEQEDPG